jgi:hypothetical protein
MKGGEGTRGIWVIQIPNRGRHEAAMTFHSFLDPGQAALILTLRLLLWYDDSTLGICAQSQADRRNVQ